NREMVVLREILAARDFGDSNMKLPLALGKDIGGDPIVANLAKMPHLLIAGTTGSGKSVAINTMILSLLYKLSPDECRLIMIDPKMLELSVYDGIPHLLSPVVTDPKKAVVALKWVVAEMEERYRKMSKMGVRNIDGYNSRVEDAQKKGELFRRTVQTGFDDETGEPVFETEEFAPEKMPYIVVGVDEMADLMMVAGKEIEACIQRLAQMARASGIHLIMATQRPSVDVITGTIKANFPTRISFQVTSKIDSRTILGEMGAEQLLGQGDMLYMAGGGRISRCHGPFVSDEEVEEIVNHLKAFGPPDYVSGVVEGPDEDRTGDIDAVPEGTPVFGHEPILRVEAPIFDAQLLETLMINRVMFPSLAASKASRIVHAAAGRNVVDFGARRAHGPEAAMAVARSSYLAGFAATSLVEAGRRLGIPVTGTMAHSYILSHDDEAAAFEAFMREFPETVLLVDTYDTLAGVDKVIDIARRLGDDFRVNAIRLDSGDIAELSKQARRRLDEAGLDRLKILASSGLDEFEIARLVGAEAPIDGFGVGTRLAVSDHAPHIDMAYKLVEYDAQPRMKLSSDKANPPGAKQVFRVLDNGKMQHDVLARRHEEAPAGGTPLLRPVVRGGEVVEDALPDLETARRHAADAIGQLPGWLRGVKIAEPPYRVAWSDELTALARTLRNA
ncbi:MAG: nicotinate phosphoribosyltransferase, partial [Phycisphaeraceae bacterium]